MTTKITFLIDSSTLPKGGASINTAVAVAHPPFLLNGTLSDPKYKVPVAGGDTVFIYTQEKNLLPTVKVAPNGVIAHSFQGDPLSVDIMKNSSLRPIDIPNFDMDPGPSPDFIAYLDDNSQWSPTPSSWTNWANNPYISQDLQASMTRTYVPYTTFQTSTLVSGELQYGVVFGLTRDGKSVEYFYFDPYLVISNP
ncbi:hypothetical protein [Stigmatella aurantiaca]|uniref:Conserved uncharacterized protein n=1 Tax=Stigmatella aurantiaca (strain DW4/3-1) TaxID=378806 RepID=Q08QU4_STIAD|nr:hypothetical protein [Stigmatella aurantiaca]ADO74784.1 conserved uncharacterized protein [Stigmatella aurantiaca DW4/3-1]EAU62852.1 hypothetical protein STIAU_8440 [Stigmatella aurantiaca DW4/3-1]